MPCIAGVQALLPVLREMGELNGHPLQQRLELRLALVAAAPWRRLADQQARAAAAASRPSAHSLAGATLPTARATLPSPASSPAKPGAAAEDPALRAAAEAQADALVMLAWKFVFGRPYGSDHFVEVRRACTFKTPTHFHVVCQGRCKYCPESRSGRNIAQ